MIVMKKTISVLLSVLLLFALTACGSTGAAEDKTSVNTESAQPAAEEKSENLSDQTEQTESGVTDGMYLNPYRKPLPRLRQMLRYLPVMFL
jgi:predicted small lipoprotein YifL